MSRRFVVEGEVWIAIDEVASSFRIEVREIETWIGEGLVPPPRAIEGTPALPSNALDTVAHLRNLTRLVGLDLPALILLLDRGSDG